MELALILFAFAGGASLSALLFKCEIRSIAKELSASNRQNEDYIERIRLRDQDVLDLARAINSLEEKRRLKSEKLAQERSMLSGGLSSLAHDIRTPLAGARGHVQLAQLDPPCNRNEHLDRALLRLKDAERILGSISDYAHASDPDKQYEKEPVRILPLLLSTLEGHEPEFNALKMEPVIEFDNEDLVVFTNEDALRRIMDNLISNALVHGEEPFSITQQEATLTFRNGIEPGDDEDIEKWFDRFYRRNPSHNNKGSGLGLSIAKQLSCSLGFQLTAQSSFDAVQFVLGFETASDRRGEPPTKTDPDYLRFDAESTV